MEAVEVFLAAALVVAAGARSKKRKKGLPASRPLSIEFSDSYFSPPDALLPQRALLPHKALLPHNALLPHKALLPQSALDPQSALLPHNALVPDIVDPAINCEEPHTAGFAHVDDVFQTAVRSSEK